MKYFSAFLLVLAVYQAAAKPEPNNSYQQNVFKTLKGVFEPVNTHIQTAVVENPTVNFPSYIPPTAISESCHCMRTLVRPQIRNEIISVPTVDRIVRTVTTPIVETINCGGGSRLATFTQGNNILSGVSGNRGLSDGIQHNAGRTNNGFFNEGNSRSFTTAQNTNTITNGVTSGNNGVKIGLVATPIITFQTSNGGNSQGFSNIFSSNGRINGF